jgi:hypothetical protein
MFVEIEKLNEILISTIKTIAGIVEIRTINDEKLIVEYVKNNKSVVNIKLGIVLLTNAYAKTIVEELHQQISYCLAKLNIKIKVFDVYIKGTR